MIVHHNSDHSISISDIIMCVSVLELEETAVEHKFIIVEVRFNLTKRRRRGRNIISQRSTVEVPGQCRNITMCAVITHHPTTLPIWPHSLHNTLIPPDQIGGPCCHLGQRKFPPGCSYWLHCTPTLSYLSLYIFSNPQSYWGMFFLPGNGKCMTEIHKSIYPFSKLWKTHVEIQQLMLFMAGFSMLGDIFPAAWPGKTLIVMQMRCTYVQLCVGQDVHCVLCFLWEK